MKNKSFAIHGYIVKSSVKEPSQGFFDTELKMRLSIAADDCYELEALERQVSEYKQNIHPDRPIGNEGEPFKHYTKMFEGLNVHFETLYYPKLDRDINTLSDEELIGKRVQVLGSIEHLRDGNCYLSPNLIQDAPFTPAFLVEEYIDDGFDI